MMYIEHTALGDNLHHILTNRVPTSSSPSATEAAAVAASALLARVREAQNGASSLHASQVQQPKCNKEWSRRPEPKLLPVESLDQLPQRPKERTASVKDLTKSDDEGQEEEQYELFHVVDSDRQEAQAEDTAAKTSVSKGGSATKSTDSIGNSLATTHFVIDLKDEGLQDKTEDEDEYEYVVTRVPKKSLLQNQHTFKPPIEQEEHQVVASQTKSQTSQKFNKKPVPEAIPIEFYQRSLLHNGNLHTSRFRLDTIGADTQKYSVVSGHLNGYPEAYSGPGATNFYSDLENTEAGWENRCDNERCKKDAQMGLNILSKLKQYFNPSSSSKDYNSAQEDSKRKRRSDDCSRESASGHLIKCRKVENHASKYVPQSEDDDVVKFRTPLPPMAQSSKQFQSNMSARCSKTSLDKTPLRKSIFSAPQIKQQLVKNTTYADIEFSDDDEPILSQPSTSAWAKVYNIPIVRTDDSVNCVPQKPPPPLIEHGTGNILASSQIPRLSTYADTVRQYKNRDVVERTGHVLGTRNSSVSSSGRVSTSESSRLLNGLNCLPTSHWSSMTRSSILAQEKESEEREKYQQLLEQVVPRLYGSSAENKIPATSNVQRRRSGLPLGSTTSSSRSSPASARRSIGLSQFILKRQPLSSTINVDDDDDDATFTGSSQLKSTPRLSKGKPIVPTIIIDDDDISDIVELGTAERHVLSQVGKIKREENSVINLCTEKTATPKKITLPYVEPVNSLQERFSSSPHMKDNWLANSQIKWLLRKRNRQDEVNETAKVADKLAAERKAAEAEIQESWRKLQIVDPEALVVDDFEDVIPEPEFVELTAEHRARINASICGPPDQVLVSKFNLNITRRDIHTLCGHNWLNDEVINFYMNLLTERGELKQSQGLPSVYAMNTFFVPRLLQAGHGGVKRWTRKVDILSKDIIPVPVHVGGVHWCMAIIHIKNRTIKYYDSMGTPNPTVLKALEQYLKDESLDKRKEPLDTSGFRIESVQGVPRQMNGSDCGVFSCMFAEYITRNKDITFSQHNMEYFRQKMILEIVTGELLQ